MLFIGFTYVFGFLVSGIGAGVGSVAGAEVVGLSSNTSVRSERDSTTFMLTERVRKGERQGANTSLGAEFQPNLLGVGRKREVCQACLYIWARNSGTDQRDHMHVVASFGLKARPACKDTTIVPKSFQMF